jgi:ammonia channel protein AmtB
MDMTVCAVAWYLVGYAFAFGATSNGFLGTTFFVGIDVGAGIGSTNQVTPAGAPPNTFNNFNTWLFEYAFAATCEYML